MTTEKQSRFTKEDAERVKNLPPGNHFIGRNDLQQLILSLKTAVVQLKRQDEDAVDMARIDSISMGKNKSDGVVSGKKYTYYFDVVYVTGPKSGEKETVSTDEIIPNPSHILRGSIGAEV
ncbi:MAG: hypothetical protein ABR981_03165 [Candidatus Micrarchaeaceae archaeon]|jgi:hypothetical protein